MRTLPHSIIPATPLTVAELETLAVMLDNGSGQMSRARDESGDYVWDQGRDLTDAMDDMFAGFYQLRDNTAAMVCGPRMPWNTAEGQIRITA